MYVYVIYISTCVCLYVGIYTYTHTYRRSYSTFRLRAEGINERNMYNVYVHKGVFLENSQRIKGNWKKGCNGLSVSLKIPSRSKSLWQGWVWFERTCVFSEIQFTKHFIEFAFVETNEVVRSNSKVILSRQTCGQRSSRVAAAGSKRRAIEFKFFFPRTNLVCAFYIKM